jgi:hypothetical protein
VVASPFGKTCRQFQKAMIYEPQVDLIAHAYGS